MLEALTNDHRTVLRGGASQEQFCMTRLMTPRTDRRVSVEKPRRFHLRLSDLVSSRSIHEQPLSHHSHTSVARRFLSAVPELPLLVFHSGSGCFFHHSLHQLYVGTNTSIRNPTYDGHAYGTTLRLAHREIEHGCSRFFG